MLFLLFLATVLATEVASQKLSAEQTVSNINGITTMTAKLDKTAQTINILNAFQTGPQLMSGFRGIISVVSSDYAAMTKREEIPKHPHWNMARRSTKYTFKEQTAVCDSLDELVTIQQTLLATVARKHGILEETGIAHQIAAQLREIEDTVDTLATSVIAEVPHCAKKATKGKDALDKSLDKTIDEYEDGFP